MGTEVSEGVSQSTGNKWKCVHMQLEKPGMIKTFYLRFRQSEWNGKQITNIDVMNVVDATERELNDQEL